MTTLNQYLNESEVSDNLEQGFEDYLSENYHGPIELMVKTNCVDPAKKLEVYYDLDSLFVIDWESMEYDFGEYINYKKGVRLTAVIDGEEIELEITECMEEFTEDLYCSISDFSKAELTNNEIANKAIEFMKKTGFNIGELEGFRKKYFGGTNESH